jgi:hypothetical protein
MLCGDSDFGEAITHDSLDSLLERGRLVAGVTSELDPEAYQLAQWWDREGAEASIEAQPRHQRKRAKRFWHERYTAECTKIRVELAQRTISRVHMRQQFKD